MFSEFFDEEEYDTKGFLFKGTKAQIEEFKNDDEYDVDVLEEEYNAETDEAIVKVSEYTWIEELIPKYPHLAATGFVQVWGEYRRIFVAISLKDSSEIDYCEDVGYFDRHYDINWHDQISVTAENTQVEMSYDSEKELKIYNYPFSAYWNK